MPPPRTQRRPGGVPPAGGAASGVPGLGHVRRSQIISTYGIGSIVDLTAGSFMPLGLEACEAQTRAAPLSSMIVYEPRLQVQLGVVEFRLAPIVEEIPRQRDRVNPRSAIPATRFPEWLECPKCHRLGRVGEPFELRADGRTVACNVCLQAVNPVRFVVACARGHIEDFPWVWWAHRNRSEGTCQAPRLELQSRGESASLGDLSVRCKTCGSASSLLDAFRGEIENRRSCTGKRPWLEDSQTCDEKPVAMQRGASNIYFPVQVSALSIPPVSEPVFQILDEHWVVLRSVPDVALRDALGGIARQTGVAVDDLLTAFAHRRSLEEGGNGVSTASARAEEYGALSAPAEAESIGSFAAQFENRLFTTAPALSPYFDLVAGASRLREIRALVGFSRIQPYPVTGERVLAALRDGHISPLARSPQAWFPAAEIRGEGVFLRFRAAAVSDWIRDNPGVVARAAELHAIAERVAAERGYEQTEAITPRLLLVHSFAHVMIRQLAIDCGYSSAALRERLYVSEGEGGSEPMQGVLIYTGSPDSEGSLGGLVRLARPDLLVEAVLRALRSSHWCGSDPVCLETSPAQAGDRVSGAACHCCLLIPETACEKFNRELDRTMLVGAADGSYRGFFAPVLASVGEG